MLLLSPLCYVCLSTSDCTILRKTEVMPCCKACQCCSSLLKWTARLCSTIPHNHTTHDTQYLAISLCLQNDLTGVDAAKNYWQAYFDKYTFEHTVLAGAEDSASRVAFVFWLDKATAPVL